MRFYEQQTLNSTYFTKHFFEKTTPNQPTPTVVAQYSYDSFSFFFVFLTRSPPAHKILRSNSMSLNLVSATEQRNVFWGVRTHLSNNDLTQLILDINHHTPLKILLPTDKACWLLANRAHLECIIYQPNDPISSQSNPFSGMPIVFQSDNFTAMYKIFRVMTY